EEVKNLTLAYPGSKSSRLPEVQEKLPTWKSYLGFTFTAEELIAPVQNIIRELDQGITGGFFYNNFMARMEGSGKSYEKEGYTFVKKFNRWVDTGIGKINKAHGDVSSFENKIF